MIDQRSSSVETEDASAKGKNASWPDLLWAGVLGFSSSFFNHRTNMPGPLALGMAVVVAQLTHLIIPAKKREYTSFGRWVRLTMFYFIAMTLGAYVVNWIAEFGVD